MSLKSKPSDPERIQKRIDAALAKHDRGEPLTEVEMRIVYWIRYSAGCHACGGRSAEVRIATSVPDPRFAGADGGGNASTP